jgi:Na+-transporting NADH:ubiquinone oxidoreductase subunit D
MASKTTPARQAFNQGLWSNNPIAVQVLGICSALAVTVQLRTAIVMALALTAVLAGSNLVISALRRLIPHNIRIIVELCVISTLVIIADELLRAFLYDISKQLSVFVGLIITNCIVMGRAETYALGNPPWPSFMDGLGNGLGYGIILVAVAFFRELMGAGNLLGFQVVPEAIYGAGYEDMGFMLLAPAAFIIIGLLVWVQRELMERRK